MLPAISFRVSSALPDEEKGTASDTSAYRSAFYEDNERCFSCHGQKTYSYTNENLGKQIKAMMFQERIIHRDEFYSSNHKSFSCTDCHSSDYEKFPHPGELRMEQIFNCIDCHGGDDKFSKFNFEIIESEYQQSVHYKLEEEGFSCWKCHDPHTYRINIRDSRNIGEAILYDNNICLNCHSDYERFQLLSDKKEINILKTHDWLPNQEAHFTSVRCIECHTQVNDTVLVAHLVRPKEMAVKGCNECHSKNSLLMSSLYKIRSKEQRKDGFFNGIIMNESYVIGANRNEYLNLLSFIIFLGVVGVIGIHVVFRIIKKRK
jgi:Zn finger protein HypA/HybF involved in hydrogenase expression